MKFICSDLDKTTQAMIPDLENCYRLYNSTGFKKIVFGIKKNLVLKMQLSRIARNTGLTNAEVLEIY